MSAVKRRVIPVFIPHLGCPHACVFCDQRRISGEPEPADADTVRRAVEGGFTTRVGGEPAELAFYGGSFTALSSEKQAELLGAAQPYLNSGRITSVRLSTRPDAVSENILKSLAELGVKTIELGAQSMRDGVLTLAGRGHAASDTREASEMVKAHGFELILQMMTGLPGDDGEGAVYTARELIKLKPDGVRIYPVVVIRGTELHRMWERGEYAEHSVEDAVRVCAKIVPMFDEAGIPVIRLGLNPTDELTNGEAVAGAYHPALGELVRSRILLEWARGQLQGAEPGGTATLEVAQRDVSAMIGHKRSNIKALEDEFKLENIKIRSKQCT